MKLWIDFSKNCPIFPKNLPDFSLDTVEKQSMIDLNSDSMKGYTFVVLGDSEAT